MSCPWQACSAPQRWLDQFPHELCMKGVQGRVWSFIWAIMCSRADQESGWLATNDCQNWPSLYFPHAIMNIFHHWLQLHLVTYHMYLVTDRTKRTYFKHQHSPKQTPWDRVEASTYRRQLNNLTKKQTANPAGCLFRETTLRGSTLPALVIIRPNLTVPLLKAEWSCLQGGVIENIAHAVLTPYGL